MSYEPHLDMEIRKLRPVELYTLGSILSISDSWKKLMSIVPKEENVFKFNSDHISIIEQTSAHRDKRNAAQIFLDEWSTMGKKRPTLKLLLELLIKAELFRAADYVACDILKQQRPKRPDYGPAASIDINDDLNQLEERPKRPDYGPTASIDINDDLNQLDVQTAQNYMYGEVASDELPVILKNNLSEKFVDVQTAQNYMYGEVASDELPVILHK